MTYICSGYTCVQIQDRHYTVYDPDRTTHFHVKQVKKYILDPEMSRIPQLTSQLTILNNKYKTLK